MPALAKLVPARAALVLIDLQRGILSRATVPHTSGEVLNTAVKLAETFRAAGSLVVLVHVSFAADRADALNQDTDQPAAGPPPPAGWDELAPELRPDAEHTIVVKKRNWGAFYGTDLDLQLRRRKIDTIVLGGIATPYGVESTARNAYELGYQLFFVEDATATVDLDDHIHVMTKIFPRIGHIVKSTDVIKHLTPNT